MSRHARRNHFSEHELTTLAEGAAQRLLAAQPAPPPAPPPGLTREQIRAIVLEELTRNSAQPGVLRRWWTRVLNRPKPQPPVQAADSP